MRLPSIVRVSKPRRFNITPRHYDPVKEEIEQRTLAIKKELEEKGILVANPSETDFSAGYQSSIRGAFRAKSKVKSSSFVGKPGLIRLIIFVLLLGGLAGYIYLGTEVLYYLVYLSLGIGMVIILKRLKSKQKNE